MAEYLIQGETLTAIADAIRNRTGVSGSMTPAKMVDNIQLVYSKGREEGHDRGYEEGYRYGYEEAELDILSNCVDWNMTTTSSSCSIYFSNVSSTYYVHMYIEVTAVVRGLCYDEEIVIPPEGDYVWDEGDFGELSGEEWELFIGEMRFSKDGT